jgi:hypothetical protein
MKEEEKSKDVLAGVHMPHSCVLNIHTHETLGVLVFDPKAQNNYLQNMKAL